MSQLLDSIGTISTIVATLVIVLGVIWHIQSGTVDGVEDALPSRRGTANDAGFEDDLRHRINRIEEKLELHRKRITRTERKLRGAGVIIFALISSVVSLYALVRNDWVPGLCFMAMALAFGTYGLVNVFSNK